MKYLIDTSAFIEYFEGGPVGNKINEIIQEEENEIITIPIIIAEVMD